MTSPLSRQWPLLPVDDEKPAPEVDDATSANSESSRQAVDGGEESKYNASRHSNLLSSLEGNNETGTETLFSNDEIFENYDFRQARQSLEYNADEGKQYAMSHFTVVELKASKCLCHMREFRSAAAAVVKTRPSPQWCSICSHSFGTGESCVIVHDIKTSQRVLKCALLTFSSISNRRA